MTFVNENISEEDKQRIDFGQLRDPVSGHPLPLPPYKWTVDHERDIALISLGGGVGDFPHFFVLYWQGRFINAFMRSSVTGDFPTYDLEVTWRLEFIGNLGNVSEQEVIAVLQEALIEKKYGP